ncbi:MAG: glycogen/starch synthase [Bacteroidia bacterium]
MRIMHVAAECYPAAKAGGLGDVVGALPKYLELAQQEAAVIIPGYHLQWILKQSWTKVFSSSVRMNNLQVPFHVMQCKNDDLGYHLFSVDIPGLFDRNGIYSDAESGMPYDDEVERYIAFQQSVLKFIQHIGGIDIIHCHDHHTGLIPFMIKYCPEYRSLAPIPTVFTIHNGQYHGAFSWEKSYLLPWYDASARGLLDWNNTVNPLATAIKCCWRLTTVSNGYLQELQYNANGLEVLLRQERMKSTGIVNGIDSKVWDPETDPMIDFNVLDDVAEFKKRNKDKLHEHFTFNGDLPLITFIGRLVYEKGADLLPAAISKFLNEGGQASFVILGTGDLGIRDSFLEMRPYFQNYFDTSISYNEGLSHQLYAGSDFIIMPSRVEPCGLNQLYAFRYGTLPIVRATGGLAETVIDISESDGNGLKFNDLSIDTICNSFHRAVGLYYLKDDFDRIRQRILHLDFSWETAAKNYIHIYQTLKNPSV